MKKLIYILPLLACILTACVKDEPYVGESTMENFTYTPTTVTKKDVVTVSVEITYIKGGITAQLVYTVNGGQEQRMDMSKSGNTFTAVIPKQPNEAEVAFYVVATNADGITSKSPIASYKVGTIPVDYTKLRLNELSGLQKFIEIYNPGDQAVNMEGVYIEKDGGVAWTGDDREIAPKGYLLLWSVDVKADHSDHPDALFFGTGLSAKKNVRIQMFTPSGVSIDDFNITKHPGSAVKGSYGRNADGKWYVQTTQTPGEANVDGSQIIDFF